MNIAKAKIETVIKTTLRFGLGGEVATVLGVAVARAGGGWVGGGGGCGCYGGYCRRCCRCGCGWCGGMGSDRGGRGGGRGEQGGGGGGAGLGLDERQVDDGGDGL